MCPRGTSFREETPMVQKESNTPLGDGLFCHLEMSAEQSDDRSLTLSGSGEPLRLTQQQALALFRVLLSHLGQISEVQLHQEREVKEVNLVIPFHLSLNRINNSSLIPFP